MIEIRCYYLVFFPLCICKALRLNSIPQHGPEMITRSQGRSMYVIELRKRRICWSPVLSIYTQMSSMPYLERASSHLTPIILEDACSGSAAFHFRLALTTNKAEYYRCIRSGSAQYLTTLHSGVWKEAEVRVRVDYFEFGCTERINWLKVITFRVESTSSRICTP